MITSKLLISRESVLAKIEELRALGNKSTFKVEFVKKDGSFREMTCMLNVSEYCTGEGLKYNPSKKGLISVFEIDNKDLDSVPSKDHYRMVNIKTLISVNFNGIDYQVVDQNFSEDFIQKTNACLLEKKSKGLKELLKTYENLNMDEKIAA